MLSKEYKSTRELLGALMEGGEAVKRDNPRGNETSYFFMVPKAQSPTGEEVINVPDGVDPQAFKAAGYRVPETASASTSGLGSTGSSSTSSWGSSSSPASSWNGMSNPTAEWGNTNSSSSGWGGSSNGFGSTQNSGFGTQNPWGSANSGLGSSSNSWGSNNGFGLNNSGNNSLSGSWNNGTNTLNNGLESTPSYMGSNPSAIGNGISSMDNTQNALKENLDYKINSDKDFLNQPSDRFSVGYNSIDNGMVNGTNKISKELSPLDSINEQTLTPKESYLLRKNLLYKKMMNLYPDNSKYNFKNLPLFIKDMNSGLYRTRISTLPPKWGNGSKERLEEKVEAGEFSQEPSSINNEILGTIADFIQSYLQMRGDDTIGGDRVAHCTANYNATKRGPTGERMARTFGTLREIVDSLMDGFNIEDSSNDQAANIRGRQGARDGLTVEEACPLHPGEYLLQY